MGIKYVKRTGSFIAKEAGGKQCTIYIDTPFIDAGDREDPSAVIPGIPALKTSDGKSVSKVTAGHYRIVGGPDLFTDDPNAP